MYFITIDKLQWAKEIIKQYEPELRELTI